MSENISEAYNKIIEVRIQETLEAKFGLKFRDVRILACLASYNQPLIPAKIAQILKYGRATITRAMRGLKAKQCVKYQADTLDKRSLRYAITSESRRIVTAYTRQTQTLFATLEGLTETVLRTKD